MQMYEHSTCSIPSPAHHCSLTLRQERLLLGSSPASSRPVAVRQALGFLMPLAEGQQAVEAGGGGWWLAAPQLRADPVLQRLQLHMFQQPALLHHYSSVELPPSTACCPREAEIITRGRLRFLPTLPSIECSVSSEREEL